MSSLRFKCRTTCTLYIDLPSPVINVPTLYCTYKDDAHVSCTFLELYSWYICVYFVHYRSIELNYPGKAAELYDKACSVSEVGMLSEEWMDLCRYLKVVKQEGNGAVEMRINCDKLQHFFFLSLSSACFHAPRMKIWWHIVLSICLCQKTNIGHTLWSQLHKSWLELLDSKKNLVTCSTVCPAAVRVNRKLTPAGVWLKVRGVLDRFIFVAYCS